ncbi:hypothetical protein [Aquisphaera insulae]|uniref:hypothetical protein n=1 Tax=Aquisphaera insulae TaxID=2712864 RepID=UPI0013ED8BE5|nr:hypothetical protein [Aquisphaera insulae]
MTPATEKGESAPRAGWIARSLLLAVFVLVTAPEWITSASRGVDGSWILGLSMAEVRGLVHGRDIAFTFGPLGFALTPTSYAGSAHHALPIRLAIFAIWCGSTGLLLFRVRGRVAPLVFLLAASLNGLPIPLGPAWSLVGMLTLAVLNLLIVAEVDRRPAWAIPAAMLAGAAMLTKFSAGVSCSGALGVWALIQLRREPSLRTVKRLLLLSLAYFGTMASLFVAYGGPLSALPAYLKLSRELASGYSAQMVSSDPAISPFVPACLVGLTVLALALSARRRWALTPVLAIILFPMFVLYKGSIVRLDAGHLQLHWPTMFSLFGLLIPIAGRYERLGRRTTVAVAALLAWTLVFPSFTTRDLAAAVRNNWYNLFHFRAVSTAVRERDEALRISMSLPERVRARIGREPVDVFPCDISVVWANHLNWRPRPVFQSYAAYTPLLDERNAELYRDPGRAPRFILYSHYAIDQEVPSLVDSRTWIEIYRWYDFVDEAGEYLLLQRRSTPRWTGGSRLASATHSMKKRLEIPAVPNGLSFLKADIELTVWGRLMAFLYRVEPPRARLEFGDGSKAIVRTVWRNADGGFLISHVPRHLASVRTLFETGAGDECVAVTFRDVSGWNFRPTFRVRVMHSPPIEDRMEPEIAAAPGGEAIR